MSKPYLQSGDTVALVACSNGLNPNLQPQITHLKAVLGSFGLKVVVSPHLYAKESVFSGTARDRAQALMACYQNPEVKAIFDVSGGDVANEILPHLDFKLIQAQSKPFWGYSDLTTVLNALYAQTGLPSVLYQVRNLIGPQGDQQQTDFYQSLFKQTNDLFSIQTRFIQGKTMTGIVVGGNIRCLLKLAGTQYWPDMQGKILLLEAMSGEVAKMTTYLNQLQQMGVFEVITGLILGTFSEMDKNNLQPDIISLVKAVVPASLPICKTQNIGHGSNSKAVVIGAEYQIKRSD